MTDQAFGGAKIALLCDDRLLVYQRDDKPGIPWPGLGIAGGGRENERNAAAVRAADAGRIRRGDRRMP